jgi:hypothetical protein
MDDVAVLAQEGDVFRTQSKAQKPLVIDIAEPAPDASLRRIICGLNQPAHQMRPGFWACRRTCRDASLRIFHGHDPSVSEQDWMDRETLVAARYDIITGNEN